MVRFGLAARNAHLVRRIGLLGATSANMLEMIGVGPFITIPILLAKMNGPQAILGWVLGALVALCDGMVWAELGAAMPGTGGPLRYLSEAYGPKRLGPADELPVHLANHFPGAALDRVWRHRIRPVCAGFCRRHMSWWQEKGIAMAVCLLITFMLYRDIRAVARLSVGCGSVVLGTVGGSRSQVYLIWTRIVCSIFLRERFAPSRSFFFGLGGATLIAMYDYGGYNNVCFFAGRGEASRKKTFPVRSSGRLIAVAALYLTMNIGIIGVVPWREAIRSTSIVSDFIQRLYGVRWAQVATMLVLWTTLASLFAVLLGYSRVPYAAAVEGRFFSRIWPPASDAQFPSFSVLFIGISSAAACLLTLDVVINALIVIQVMVQFMAQMIAVTLIRRNRPDIVRPYHMALYPAHQRDRVPGMAVYPGGERPAVHSAGRGLADLRRRGISPARPARRRMALRGERWPESKTLDVIVGGDLFIDLIMSGFASWPQPGTEAFAEELHREVGGGAAISACGLARLGSRAAVFGMAGGRRRLVRRPSETFRRRYFAHAFRPRGADRRDASPSARRGSGHF